MEHTQELPTMPQGGLTYMGRFPGYEPKQAMEAFFSASAEHERPSYEERRDVWVALGNGYALVVGCFVEPDGTPVVVWTSVSESTNSHPPHELFMGEVFSALKQSAGDIRAVLGDEDITESGSYGTSLRQLRPSELDGDPPNRMKEEFIWPALNHEFPGQWAEFWPGSGAGFVNEGVGVAVMYNDSEYFKLATIALTGLQISTELLEGLWEVNATLAFGGVFLSSVEDSWAAVWTFKFRSDWLDPSSRATRQMMVDTLANASFMTRTAAGILQAKGCGGSAFIAEPDADPAAWALITASHV